MNTAAEKPYKVVRTKDGRYEVVMKVGEKVESLRPRRIYDIKQSAYYLKSSLNKKHKEEQDESSAQ